MTEQSYYQAQQDEKETEDNIKEDSQAECLMSEVVITFPVGDVNND